MKRLMILTVAILLAGAGTGYAQSQDANSRKMARKQMKAEQDARDRLAFEEARKAIEAKEFVLEADQVSFKSGSTAQVSSNTNFVAVQGDKAVVQVAFDIPVSGPNGLGGVTVSGSTSDYRQSVDKKGNIRVSMNVIGTGDFPHRSISTFLTGATRPAWTSRPISTRGASRCGANSCRSPRVIFSRAALSDRPTLPCH